MHRSIAEMLALALGGRPAGTGWMARCPSHADKTPSLSINDSDSGLPLVHCHAGCDQRTVVASLQDLGLWKYGAFDYRDAQLRRPAVSAQSSRSIHRTAQAVKIWSNCRSAVGTLAEVYLRARGLHLPPPPTLRFSSSLAYSPNTSLPAMVALVTHGERGTPIGIHRTFLRPDGTGKANVDAPKKMLGPCSGGAVRLGKVDAAVLVTEGIENALTGTCCCGLPAWAALSSSGLKSLVLPDGVKDVTILADGDTTGETSAELAALRWCREGRRVRIARSPTGYDFNDILLGKCPPSTGDGHEI